ncbi:MAG: FAD-dependent oxidoreductase [Candidatus Obscuribacterales bacterium]|nr:FAD-dependent oxidoreductase [Candidatus Obscuribacterales bacterium]
MSKFISRATFLKGIVGAAAAAGAAKVLLDRREEKLPFPCRMLGPSMAKGHKIRNGSAAELVAKTSPTSSREIVIVGGGIAGLSAAWWLKKQGITDFTVLEMENEVGGNSSSGRNDTSAYPWGAHYIPLANEESSYVRTFFEEEGIIQAMKGGKPVYNELYLCHEPQERLFKDGIFSEGLVPKRGLQPADKVEMERFFNLVTELRKTRGNDGRFAFAIPIELSSRDVQWRSLDQISMADWLAQQGFKSAPLLWYIDYCCRDDYGSLGRNVSAWAGLHYFAGRRGAAANAEMNSVVTWPEGNGYVVECLRKRLEPHLQTGSPAVSIRSSNGKLHTVHLNKDDSRQCIESNYVIFCAPRFISPYIISGYVSPLQGQTNAPSYAPWLVANITLKGIPVARGAELSWDNVAYRSPSLGYVVANHQDITTGRNNLVVTYYRPLADEAPAAARRKLSETAAMEWANIIAQELERMHPGITRQILSMDLWPWGHGMISPAPGYIWGTVREKMTHSHGNIFFAHSDISGISNFEEAQYRGVEAAKAILARRGQTG